MSNVWITRKGAGGTIGSAFAVISVSYPTGSDCTLSRDGKIFRDRRSSGTALFAVPEAGNWVVAISDGEHTNTRTVAITERGQAERIVISYNDALFAPNSGSEAQWQTSGRATAGSGSIRVHGTANWVDGEISSWAYLKEPISMADRTKLTVELTCTEIRETPAVSGSGAIYIIPEDRNPTSSLYAAISQSVTAGEHTGENACEIDVSNLDAGKRYYVAFCARGRRTDYGGTVYEASLTFTVTGAVLT